MGEVRIGDWVNARVLLVARNRSHEPSSIHWDEVKLGKSRPPLPRHPYFWHFGQKKVERLLMTVRRMVLPQVRQESPSRSYTRRVCWK
jgi:hypothetical protein